MWLHSHFGKSFAWEIKERGVNVVAAPTWSNCSHSANGIRSDLRPGDPALGRVERPSRPKRWRHDLTRWKRTSTVPASFRGPTGEARRASQGRAISRAARLAVQRSIFSSGWWRSICHECTFVGAVAANRVAGQCRSPSVRVRKSAFSDGSHDVPGHPP